MSHRDQFIWKRTSQLTLKCYQITQNFPREELYGLTNQQEEGEGEGEGEGKILNSFRIRSFLNFDSQLGSLSSLLSSFPFVLPLPLHSVPANIAEGYGRGSTADYIRFIHIAEGSLREVDTHLWIARELGYVNKEDSEALFKEIDECLRLLLSTARKLQSNIR